MLRIFDKIFSVLPFIILFFHLIKTFYNRDILYILPHIIYTYTVSFLFKVLFKKNRRSKTYEFKEWKIPKLFKQLKVHYGFPSSHTMFFLKYYLLNPNLINFVILTLGCFSRVYYQHHTKREIVYTILFVLILDWIILNVIDFIF
ncbi:hypothetical protein A0H76_1782 [Hepatospora eriocheir]|uniref:Phosphatidic acid phosphatase type 2/haloperoxidase domain-containing protein n=1 Tax=Hepatospora eriocheir TaxID=1081669 RepID=A0A1X0QGU6_9MICR|nr:hypothetical protein A0H76_1782 [Hepatospora eriocheir]